MEGSSGKRTQERLSERSSRDLLRCDRFVCYVLGEVVGEEDLQAVMSIASATELSQKQNEA